MEVKQTEFSQEKMEVLRMEAATPAKEVAGKAIGKHGLFYITLIVVIGVVSSLFLEENKNCRSDGATGCVIDRAHLHAQRYCRGYT